MFVPSFSFFGLVIRVELQGSYLYLEKPSGTSGDFSTLISHSSAIRWDHTHQQAGCNHLGQTAGTHAAHHHAVGGALAQLQLLRNVFASDNC